MDKNESKYFLTASFMDEALLLLLQKKDFEFITVKELCKKAGVNRSTFYLHYETMDELLLETVEKLNKNFSASLPQREKEDFNLITPKFLKPYLEFVKKNRQAFKATEQRPEIFKVEESFQRMQQGVFNPILDHYKVKEEDKEYIFTFFTKGIISVVFRWIKNDCKGKIDTMKNLIQHCVGRVD